MKENPVPLDLDALLAHSDWVRALALHLVDDAHLADDVAQEAWLAALKKPPRGALTPWLKAVTVNLARKAMRQRIRVGERERRAARPELQTERFEAHRAVVQAVDALDEPWRTTVVLRYFDGLPPRVIAAQMDIPVATVRTRLRRALGFLRGRLHRDFGGEGNAWTLALVPLLPMKAEGSPIAGVGTGVALMTKKATLALVVLLAALSLVWWVDRDDSSERPGRAQGRSATLPAAAPHGTTSEAMESAPPRLAPGFATLRARVEAPGGTPLRGVRVELVRRQFVAVTTKDGRRIEVPPLVLALATTTADGLVTLTRPPRDWTGTLYFRAVGHGWRSGTIAVRHTKTTRIVCRPTRAVQVRTHDSDGPTQATVLVSVVEYSRGSRDILDPLHTTEGGQATFEAFPDERLEVFAINGLGCSSAWLGTVPATGPVEPIQLSISNESMQARLVFGTEPVVSAEAWLDGVRVDRGPSANDGRIRLARIPEYRFLDVEFRLPWLYHPLITEDITDEPKGARLVKLIGFCRSRRGVVRVLSRDGAPIQGALVGLQRHVGFQVVGQIVTDKSGQAVVHARRRYGSHDGRGIVWRYATKAIVYAEGYAPLIVEVGEGENDVRLNNVTRRTVDVVDKLGAPVPHARVYLHHQPDGDQVGYGIQLVADGRGRCSVPDQANWSVRARAFGGGRHLRQSEPVPLGTASAPLRLEISIPSPFALRVVVRNADGSGVSEPIHLRLHSNNVGQSRDTVLVRGTWSETAIWNGHFRIRARGLRSGLDAVAKVDVSPEAPRQPPIELTLSAPWLIRVRPLGIPHATDSRPWRARGYSGTRDVWVPLSVHENRGLLDVRLPAAGPWTLELSRGTLRETLSAVSAVQSDQPKTHEVSFTESALLIVEFGEHVRGQPRLMLLPLHDDGVPVAAKPQRKEGSWNGTLATWQLPQGRYHFALVDGDRSESWLWATSNAVDLLAGQETRLTLAARPIAVMSVVPSGDAPIEWGALTVHPEDPALAWLASAVRLRIRETSDGPKLPLWPGNYVVRDSKARDLYRLHVRAGDQKIALVPVR